MCKSYKIKNFIDLSEKEKKKILKWRNNPLIAKYMLTKNISLNEHLKFIDNLKNNNKKRYFLVENIGVIYFTLHSNEIVEIGLYKNPNKQKVGNKLLKTAIEYAFEELKAKKIILYVFEDNIKAINLYKKFGFKEIDKQKNIIKMELIKSEKRKSYANREN